MKPLENSKMSKKNIEAARDFAARAAEKQGWKLNPDFEHVSDVVEGLATNFSRFGYYLCPCRDGGIERRIDADITCPCDYANADINDYGHCYCGLFVSPDFAVTGKKAEPIPERRPIELRAPEPAEIKTRDSKLQAEDIGRVLSNDNPEIADSGTKARIATIATKTVSIEIGGDLCGIKELIRHINELEYELKSVHRLSLNEALCLCCISNFIRTPGECAKQMGLSRSRISRILNSLEGKKLIERQLMLENLRSTELNLTEKGADRLKKLRMCGFSFSKLDNLSPAQTAMESTG